MPIPNATLSSFFFFFFAVAINSTNEANKASGTRYRKSKIDFLRFVMCLQQAPVFQGFFFFFYAVAINSTNEANKAGGTHL